jgi:DNA-binding SARP family transcriptional activator
MTALNIHLLGKFSVECNAKVLSVFSACKLQELFSYLLLYRDRPHSREILAGHLWGDSTTEKSRKYLRQTLWHLQTALDMKGSGDAPGVCLHVEHDWVQIDTHRTMWLDVAVLEKAFTLVQDVPGCDLNPEQAAALQVAVELYRGDLLEGWYQDWCLFERELLQNKYLMILDKLLGYCLSHQEYDAGQHYGSLILRFDRARESTHRQLMRMLHRSGDRTGALRQYERCVSALREELGVGPDTLTRALYEEIRGAHPQMLIAQIDEATSPDTAISLPEMLGRLKRLQRMLAHVQQRVKRDIKTVELGLKPFKH